MRFEIPARAKGKLDHIDRTIKRYLKNSRGIITIFVSTSYIFVEHN